MNGSNQMRILAWPLNPPLNPYTGLVFSNLGPGMKVDGWPGNLLRKYDVWHVHWPDALLGIPNTAHALLKVSGMFAAMDYLRVRGAKVVWTIHNLASHEARHPHLEAWFWRQFIPRVDGVISLSSEGLGMAFERFPRLKEIPASVIPHGHYRDQYPQVPENSRRVLGILESAKVVLFFGAVRAYKNVETLVHAFREVRQENALLLIAGQPNSRELAEKIVKQAREDTRVVLKFEFVEDHRVWTYLNAADLVVLPYREVLNSGSAMLALSCNRPVLVPDLGSMSELAREFSDNWVRTFHGHLDTAMLSSALNWATQSARPQLCPMPDKFHWEHIGSATVRFYEQVVFGSYKSEAGEQLETLNSGETRP